MAGRSHLRRATPGAGAAGTVLSCGSAAPYDPVGEPDASPDHGGRVDLPAPSLRMSSARMPGR